MGRKLGDVIIGLLILTFMITGFSIFVLHADATVGVNSGIRGSLIGLQGNISGVNTLEQSVTEITDESGEFVVEGDTDLEERGSDISGITNLLSKNVLVRLFSTIGEKLQIPSIVVTLAASLIFITIMILLLRTILGETKV